MDELCKRWKTNVEHGLTDAQACGFLHGYMMLASYKRDTDDDCWNMFLQWKVWQSTAPMRSPLHPPLQSGSSSAGDNDANDDDQAVITLKMAMRTRPDFLPNLSQVLQFPKEKVLSLRNSALRYGEEMLCLQMSLFWLLSTSLAWRRPLLPCLRHPGLTIVFTVIWCFFQNAENCSTTSLSMITF